VTAAPVPRAGLKVVPQPGNGCHLYPVLKPGKARGRSPDSVVEDQLGPCPKGSEEQVRAIRWDRNGFRRATAQLAQQVRRGREPRLVVTGDLRRVFAEPPLPDVAGFEREDDD